MGKIGDSSFTFVFEIKSDSTNEVCAVGDTVIVSISDYIENKKKNLTEKQREVIQLFTQPFTLTATGPISRL